MATAPVRRFSPAEYLEIERRADVRHEFFRGEMFAMSGASRAHNIIALNLSSRLLEQLRPRGCEVYISDMRVHVARSGLFTYPDVVVACDQPRFLDDAFDTLLNPRVIVEVLSPSTELYDRGKKFAHYREIESLCEYIMIAQNAWIVEHYQRHGDHWRLTAHGIPEAILSLESVPARVPLAQIYESVRFDSDAS